MRYPKIVYGLYGGKITVVQLVLTIPNPIDFVKNYDKIGGDENFQIRQIARGLEVFYLTRNFIYYRITP